MKTKRILECSSRGDIRFSALYAKVKIGNKYDSIENHYQLAKRFSNGMIPTNWKQCKGKKPTHFVIGKMTIPLEKSVEFYDNLWYKYLDDNPSLVEVLAQYDDFSDMFNSKNAYVCQADSIRKYMKIVRGKKYN